MGSEANRLRKKWQHYSGEQAGRAEQSFFDAFSNAFTDTEYTIRAKPKEFSRAYVDVQLPSQVLSEIYNPSEPIKKHGVFPDYAIDNKETGKTIYIEVKRQDGWIEGGQRSDGRGNAHERSCKFFTPGLMSLLRKEGNISEPNLPFWTVFLGNITRDPCRVREITCWYYGHEGNFFFWRDPSNPEPLFEHFEAHIAPILR
ncbi:MunI family type II restriction endonuclease [Halomonas caseinilytica]|uniref:MunI family type II restriction endonuclease n=1 Tax=Halomonas caseinilytica TaxID=438744 RepID=UPI0009F6CE0E|nr:MunI family type II restriction endonuclease [Halomonas caseinilytica]